jgi:hypothetical protein
MPEENAAPTSTTDDLFGAVEAAAETSFQELPAPVLNPQPQTIQVVSSVTPRIDSLADTKVRTWIDNTGRFRTEGRLIEIEDDGVRLLKTTGKTCTVPNSRLSDADAAYVASVVQQLETSRLAMLSSK